MATNRIVRIIIGLALIGYGIYSGNAWFFAGVIPLVTGILDICPRKILSSYFSKEECCEGDTCCSSNQDDKSACCSTEETDNNSCCTPATDIKETKITSFKPITKSQDGVTKIEILGTGCTKCIALEKVVNEVVENLEGDYDVEKVSDIQEIMAYNVVSTPGLVINGTVVSTGKLLTVDEVKKLLAV